MSSPDCIRPAGADGYSGSHRLGRARKGFGQARKSRHSGRLGRADEGGSLSRARVDRRRRRSGSSAQALAAV
ncbi:MAG: hypothetical protein MZV64_10180 [Ignavibacteriales bacterium]|nr:hypothetical protein [Ignavibacteriales bacterium]